MKKNLNLINSIIIGFFNLNFLFIYSYFFNLNYNHWLIDLNVIIIFGVTQNPVIHKTAPCPFLALEQFTGGQRCNVAMMASWDSDLISHFVNAGGVHYHQLMELARPLCINYQHTICVNLNQSSAKFLWWTATSQRVRPGRSPVPSTPVMQIYCLNDKNDLKEDGQPAFPLLNLNCKMLETE